MLRFLMFWIRLALSPSLVLCSAALLIHVGDALSQASWRHPLIAALSAGFAFRVIVHISIKALRLPDPLDFVDTLEHELTHAIMGYATLCPPQSLRAGLRSGGEVRFHRVNPLIVLAPYFFPLWSTMSLLVARFGPASVAGEARLAAAFLAGTFLFRVGRETRLKQPDLREYGRVFSLAAIAMALPLAAIAWMRLAELPSREILEPAMRMAIAWYRQAMKFVLN